MNWEDLPPYFINSKFEFICNGQTIWVNGQTGLIARYTKKGLIDIHGRESTCIHCSTTKTHSLCEFFSLLEEYHGIKYSDLTKDN